MGHHHSPAETAKAGEAGAASVPPPSLPPEHMAAADTGSNIGLPAEQDDVASLDAGYADSGDGGDLA